MEPVDLLVFGGSGFVGARLVMAAVRAGRSVAYTYANHAVHLPAAAYCVSMQDGQALEACIAETQPHNIVYCAVPRPGSDSSEHEAVSVNGVSRVLSALGCRQNCRLVYVSTNAVFSGKNGPYREDAAPDPEGVREPYRIYAMTRTKGEQIALSGWKNVTIARTADVNGWDVNGRLNPRLFSIVEHLKTGKEMMRLNEAYITPTLVDNLAACLLEISNPDYEYRGVLHLAGSEQISYYDFARLVARQIQADERLIKPDDSKSWNTGLDTSQTQRRLRTRLLGAQEQVKVIFG